MRALAEPAMWSVRRTLVSRWTIAGRSACRRTLRHIAVCRLRRRSPRPSVLDAAFLAYWLQSTACSSMRSVRRSTECHVSRRERVMRLAPFRPAASSPHPKSHRRLPRRKDRRHRRPDREEAKAPGPAGRGARRPHQPGGDQGPRPHRADEGLRHPVDWGDTGHWEVRRFEGISAGTTFGTARPKNEWGDYAQRRLHQRRRY